MPGRQYSRLDRVLSGFGSALATVAAPTRPGTRANPADRVNDIEFDDRTRRHAAGLMRVNHAGEIAAQALYQGHASVARDDSVAERMSHAADEEYDHLAWCEQRLAELESRPSLFGPLWYGGAFVIGAASGLLGDKWSLGFIAETERQVCEHLDRHLERLPDNDARSRAIVSTMRDEEAVHGADAKSAGAAELPAPVKRLMELTSRVMTTVAYRV